MPILGIELRVHEIRYDADFLTSTSLVENQLGTSISVVITYFHPCSHVELG